MSFDSAFLDILACPRCRASLAWVERRAELHCADCSLAYPVKDGIPDLLPESGRSTADDD
jgi:uncharacterized protein YbaR (Trm112 family)